MLRDTGQPFGLSTALFAPGDVTLATLRDVSAQGFTCIRLSASAWPDSAFDSGVIGDLFTALSTASLSLDSIDVSAAVSASTHSSGTTSLADAHAGSRAAAVQRHLRAVEVSRRIPFRTLIVSLDDGGTAPRRDAVLESLDALATSASHAGVTIGVRLARRGLAAPSSLVDLIDELGAPRGLGVCLDTGRAHADGIVLDAIDDLAEHIVAVALSDNRGRTDERGLPFSGSIPWPAVTTTLQKVGFSGAWVIEGTRPGAEWAQTLVQVGAARKRIERLCLDAY